MNAAVEQLEMLGRPGVKVPDEYQQQTALKCKSRLHAMLKCVEISDLTPKQIYGPLGIEQRQWSRIVAGTAFLNPEQLFPLMVLCGNVVPLRYDVWKCGFSPLVPVRTDLEYRIAQLEADLADERRVTKRLGEMLRGQ